MITAMPVVETITGKKMYVIRLCSDDNVDEIRASLKGPYVSVIASIDGTSSFNLYVYEYIIGEKSSTSLINISEEDVILLDYEEATNSLQLTKVISDANFTKHYKITVGPYFRNIDIIYVCRNKLEQAVVITPLPDPVLSDQTPQYVAGGITPWDIIKQMSPRACSPIELFCQYNIIKYIMRYPYKGTPVPDIDKMIHYLTEIKKLYMKINTTGEKEVAQ